MERTKEDPRKKNRADKFLKLSKALKENLRRRKEPPGSAGGKVVG